MAARALVPERASQMTTSERLRNSFAMCGRTETIAMHLAALATCYERPFPPLVQGMYVETLAQLTDEQVIVALTRAQNEESKFFPPPARLRELADIETPDQCSERQAREGLDWVIWRIRKHGVEGRCRRGALLRSAGRDESGYHAEEWEQIPPPPTPDPIRSALEQLGAGDVEAGVKLIAEHPLVRGADEYPSLGLKLSAIEKLEARWIEAWRKANR